MRLEQSKPLITAEHFHFHRRDQLPTETVAEYVAQLRRLSVNCEFEAHLDDALCDHLVCGLRSKAMQKRLLSVKDLTFQDALDTAQAMESADKGTKALQGPETVSVHQSTKFPRQKALIRAEALHSCIML